MKDFFKTCPLSYQHKGVAILVLSILAMTAGNCFVHGLSCKYSSWTILFYKSLWALVLLLVTRSSYKKFFLDVKHASIKLNMARALFGCLGGILWIRSVQCLPLQDVSALGLTSSFFSAFGGYILFKEKSNHYKNIGLFIGFLGAYIIIHPHFKNEEWLYIFPLLSAFCFGVSALLARFLATHDQEATTSFYLFVTMLVVSIPFGFGWPNGILDACFLMMIGLCYGVSQILYVKAYSYAEASYLASFKYIKVPLHMLAGFLFFTELPNFSSLLGIFILISALIYSSRISLKTKYFKT